MKPVRKSARLLLAGLLASGVATGAATSASAQMPATFGWGGLYVGLGASLAHFSFPSNELHISLYLGLNHLLGRIVVGAEGYLTMAREFGGTPFFARAGVEGRTGFLITPTILGYAAVGFAVYDAGNRYLTLGGGVEVAVGEAFTVDLGYNWEDRVGAATTGHRVTLSFNWQLAN